jgi:hypothetical protein
MEGEYLKKVEMSFKEQFNYSILSDDQNLNIYHLALVMPLGSSKPHSQALVSLQTER